MSRDEFYKKYFTEKFASGVEEIVASLEVSIKETIKDSKGIKDGLVTECIVLLKENRQANRKALAFAKKVKKLLRKV